MAPWLKIQNQKTCWSIHLTYLQLEILLGFMKSNFDSNQGLADPLLSKMARCGKTKLDSHICRNLHSAAKKFGKVLPVRISHIPTMVRISRRRPQRVPVNYPVLYLSDWAECIFNSGGHFFLGGRNLDYAGEFQQVLVDYWDKFHAADPNFGFCNEVPRSEWGQAIPLALHGDEGRGRQKQPVMVMAAQTIIPLQSKKTNMAGTFN